MRDWQLKSGDPLCLTLASDIRLGPGDYCDDRTWELSLHSSDPPALSLQTTYGLRARSMRLYPQFTLGETSITDPAVFAQPPIVRQVFPNFIRLTFSPFKDIDVIAEFWAPQPHTIAGRFEIENNGQAGRVVQLDLIGQLNPTEGQRMGPMEMQAATVLTGLTERLFPVVFMTGGPKAGIGPYPSLALKLDLAPNVPRIVTWVNAAERDRESSFNLARSVASFKWEAERTRIELLNGGQVEIYTGDPDWDAALMLAQKQAVQLMVGSTAQLPNPSFVLARLPDMGYSLRGDGSDYNHLWNGQPPLEAYFLADLLLPVAPNLVKGLLRNYLAVQAEDGFIDWKPGLGGQRSKLLASPLLASLAWRYYETTEDKAFLEECFDPLMKFLQKWFSREHDRDQDGAPEWDHPMQAGEEDHPIYAPWHTWSQGVDISTAESPGLNAFLYMECLALKNIARLTGRDDSVPGLDATTELLKRAVEAAWDEGAAIYADRDRDTHFCTRAELLMERNGSGTSLLRRDFAEPVRLFLNIETDRTVRRHPMVFVHGKSATGQPRVERIGDDQVRWMPGWGRATGRHVYSAVQRVEVRGLEPDDRITISSVGYSYQDHSMLAPLWAGIPGEERAKRLVEETLCNPQRFWRAYGLPATVLPMKNDEGRILAATNLPWNVLAAEGLLKYGFTAQAAELTARLMRAVIQNLKRESAFRRYYNADSGQGVGERNALNGLAPLGLFLDVLGVRLISPRKVGLNGFNPFPWPVTVKYRGLTVFRQKDKTILIFPDGQTVTIDDPAPRIVSYE